MVKRDKILRRMYRNPRDVRFEELQTVLLHTGFSMRKGKGSHMIFSHPELQSILTIPYARIVRPEYVKEALHTISTLELQRTEGRTLPQQSRKGENTMQNLTSEQRQFLDAIRAGNRDMVLDYLERDVKLDFATSDGITPLMQAARFGHENIAELLIYKRVDLYARDAQEYTAIDHAIQHGNVDFAQFVTNEMLVRAAAIGDHDKVLQALNRDEYPPADINAQDIEGRTAIMYAVRNEDKAMLETLLERGPNLELVDSYGMTAMAYAVGRDNTKIGEMLTSHGAQPIYPYLSEYIEEQLRDVPSLTHPKEPLDVTHQPRDPGSVFEVLDNIRVKDISSDNGRWQWTVEYNYRSSDSSQSTSLKNKYCTDDRGEGLFVREQGTWEQICDANKFSLAGCSQSVAVQKIREIVEKENEREVNIDIPRIAMTKVTLERREGYEFELGIREAHTWPEANCIVREWARTAPKDGSYDKCSFVVTYQDGLTYKGQYDLRYGDTQNADLGREIQNFCEFQAGLRTPSWAKDFPAQWKEHLDRVTADGTATKCQDFLERYEMPVAELAQTRNLEKGLDRE